jgi:uncharacterized protein YyaL (SSP411 family)
VKRRHEAVKMDPNLLIHEKSPYLLQHAHNPVDWRPWGKEAFEKAREEDKLIFLSVGYSTCHWCHVMAHESFEDSEIARLLNEVFVCIKVDREERPDIDKVYMTICQMMTGSGGWPLTVVMTPDRQPVFAATYIPRESRFGRVGMFDLIPRIREVWTNRREELLKSADQIVAAIRQAEDGNRSGILSKENLDRAYEDLHERYDGAHGGFGPPPKFPMPHQMMFLLRYWRWTGRGKALGMVEKTLEAMRNGGMYDHIGYGFHRYSTDEKWLVPHFEKMLYDQALLSMAYTEAYLVTGHEVFKETAHEIFSYVLRDMTSPAGGFYSAEDADSEGQEGRFYLWTHDDIEQALGRDEAEWIIRAFEVEKTGNFVDELTGRKTGCNILHRKKDTAKLAGVSGMSEKSFRDKMSAARQKLYAAREKRIHPHKDDKILTDWNGLMIAAFAKGARVFAEPAYIKAACGAVDFILKNMRKPDGRLLHRYREGQAAIAANLDDYAFLIHGLIGCYDATFDAGYLKTALSLQECLTGHFWDGNKGGYYFTPDDGEDLIVRQKDSYDGAIPSGNSVAMLNLIRLARMTGNHALEVQTAQISRTFAGSVRQSPAGHSQFMIALGFLEHPSYEIVITGEPGAEDTEKMIGALRRHFLPNAVVIYRPPGNAAADIVRIAPFTKDIEPLHGKATAYVCTNFTCHSPTTNVEEMLRLLS